MVGGGGSFGSSRRDANLEWVGQASIKGKSEVLRMSYLTLVLAGLQFTWSVEMGYGTPYLLSLGLSKSLMSLVFVAGPLSGLVTQPVIGILSDKSTSKYGRRRPFMVTGSIAVSIALLMIGWTREIAILFGGSSGAAIGFAVLSIFLVDFSINAVQAACRALIVDTLPPHLQEKGNAYASRMIGIGSIVGYLLGYIDLTRFFNFIGDTQLKVLTFMSVIALIATVAITCWAVEEKVLVTQEEADVSAALTIFKSLWESIRYLPKGIRDICIVQFFAWVGWFPFLFYTSTWVGEVYARHDRGLPTGTDGVGPDDAVGEIGRVGSRALLLFSIVSLSCSLAFPLFVGSPKPDLTPQEAAARHPFRVKLDTALDYLRPFFPTLTTAWALSQGVFAIAMCLTFFVHDVVFATVVVGLCGVSWALTTWAPFSLIGEEILKMGNGDVAPSLSGPGPQFEMVEQDEKVRLRSPSLEGNGSAERPMHNDREEEEDDDRVIFQLDRRHSQETINLDLERQNTNSEGESGTDSGVYLGIHNIFIVAPQFVITFLSSIIFAILAEHSPELTEGTAGGHGEEAGTNSIGIVLKVGGVSAAVSAVLAWRMRNKNG